MLQVALLHPTIVTLIAALFMAGFYRCSRVFRIIAASFPVLIFISLYILNQVIYLPDSALEKLESSGLGYGIEYVLGQGFLSVNFELMNLKFISVFSGDTLLIAFAISIILFVANLYAISSQERFAKPIAIFGSLYAGCSYMALFSGDLIMLAIALELMMVASSAIIFLGGSRGSYNAAKRYFITHLLSGNMIIIGIACLIIKNDSYEIVNITSILNAADMESCFPAAVIMLIGLTVNIAAFPFSGWMVNCYTKASPAGFIYLICFTTKVSIIVLLKLFAGLEVLKYIAIVMIIYASFKAIFENNILGLLCLLSIIQMGFMVIAIADGRQMMLKAVYLYLCLHMLYKVSLAIIVSTITENSKITCCSNIHRIKNPVIWVGILISVMAMIGAPLSATFMIKSYISHSYLDNATYYLITLLSAITIISLPCKRYLASKKSIILELSGMSRFIIGFMSLLVLLCTFALPFASKNLIHSENIDLWNSALLNDVSSFGYISLFSYDSLKQIGILTIALVISLLVNLPKLNSKSLNVIDHLGDIMISCYKYLSDADNKDSEKEDWKLISLEEQIMRRLRFAHNQQTAILIVFSIFILMLVTFIG